MNPIRKRARIRSAALLKHDDDSTGLLLLQQRSWVLNHHTTLRNQQSNQSFSKPLSTLLFTFLFLNLNSSITGVHGILCTQLQPATLSSLYQVLSTPSRTSFLCPFTIEGPEACDTDEPFVLDSSFRARSKTLKCDLNHQVGGRCKIDCNVDSHFVVMDGKELILDSVILQGAKKGSVRVQGSSFRSIGSTWRK